MIGATLLPGRCLIRPDYQSETPGGLALPDIFDGRQSSGVIVNAGTTADISAGDRVIFSRLSAADVGADEDLLLVRHEDVMAVIV